MWFEWLVRRFDMGALAAVSALQQQPVDGQQGADQTTSTTSDASNLNRRKAARRVPTPHIFPPTPGPTLLLPNDIVSPPSCVVWSPLFENSPCKDLGYHSPGGLKVLSSNLFGDQIEAVPSNGWAPEQQALNHLAREYLQTAQELKPCTLMSNHGHETPTTSGRDKPPYTPPGYKELRAGFWKRLVETGMCHNEDDNNLNLTETEISTCESTRSIHTRQKNGILEDDLDKRLSTAEIEVVLSEKQNGEEQEELETSPSPTNGISHCVGVQDGVTCISLSEHPYGRNNIAFLEDNQDVDICRTGASSRETSEGEGMSVVAVAAGLTGCEKQEGSVNNLGSGGIGRGRIAEDGIPINIAIFREPWGEGRAPVGNLGCNRREDEGDMIWNNANWCVVDSYITGHGKETTWTVRGFEEDDGILEDLSDCKQGHRSNRLLLANDASNHDGPMITGVDVAETCHGPFPKWTQQALQERVAENLRESEGMSQEGDTINNLHKKMDKEEIESGNTEGAQCRVAMLNELMSRGNSLHCRMGGKVLEEAVLSETRDKAEGGGTEESLDNYDNPSCIHESWRKMHRSLNSIVGPSTMKSDGDKAADLSNAVSLGREFRRRKRGSVRRRGGESPSSSSAAAMASCVSKIGDTVESVRRTQEDAAALAFKLAEIHARDAKMLRANASSIRNHVDALHSEVQQFHAAWQAMVVKYPWQNILKTILVAISLVSGAMGLPRAINSLLQLFFGSVHSPSRRKGKTLLAMTILCSGSYFGKEIWQSLDRVQETRKAHEAYFREKLRVILKLTSTLFTLAHDEAQEVEEKGQIVVV